MRQPDVLKLDDWELLRLVQPELARLFGIRGLPVYTHVQRWPRAIPQYTLGYQRRQATRSRGSSIGARVSFIGGNLPRLAISAAIASNPAGGGRRGRGPGKTPT